MPAVSLVESKKHYDAPAAAFYFYITGEWPDSYLGSRAQTPSQINRLTQEYLSRKSTTLQKDFKNYNNQKDYKIKDLCYPMAIYSHPPYLVKSQVLSKIDRTIDRINDNEKRDREKEGPFISTYGDPSLNPSMAKWPENIGFGGGNPHALADTLMEKDCQNQQENSQRYNLDYLDDLMTDKKSDLENTPRYKPSDCQSSMLDKPKSLNESECPLWILNKKIDYNTSTSTQKKSINTGLCYEVSLENGTSTAPCNPMLSSQKFKKTNDDKFQSVIDSNITFSGNDDNIIPQCAICRQPGLEITPMRKDSRGKLHCLRTGLKTNNLQPRGNHPSKRCKSYTVRHNLDTSNSDDPYSSNSYYESDDGRCILTSSSSGALGDLAKNELPLDANCGHDVSYYATYEKDDGTIESSPVVGLNYEYTEDSSTNQYATGKITEKTEEGYNITGSDTPIDSSQIRHNIYPICGNDL